MDTTLRKATDQVALLLDSVGDNRTAPTPCAGWDLGALVDHVVAAPARFAQMARGEQPAWEAAPEAGTHPARTFRGHVADLEAALGEGEGFPPGMMIGELAVHSYDLARTFDMPTGQLDPEVAGEGLAFMQANLKPDMRAPAFAPERQAPDGADAYERLAAFAGREV